MNTSGQFTTSGTMDDVAMRLQNSAMFCVTLAALVGIAVEADLTGAGDPDRRLVKLRDILKLTENEANAFVPRLSSVPRTDAEQLAIRLAGAYLKQAMEAARRALQDRGGHTDASDLVSMALEDAVPTLAMLQDAAAQTWEEESVEVSELRHYGSPRP